MTKTVTPSIIARWLELRHDTVMKWIKTKDLPALNIASAGRGSRYIIFRKDLTAFLLRRGMTEERIKELIN